MRPCGDRNYTRQPADLDGRQTLRGAVVAKLTLVIRSPGPHAAVRLSASEWLVPAATMSTPVSVVICFGKSRRVVLPSPS
jgi:hypothetical protein